MEIGNKKFIFDQYTYVMGILNVTPDSFSDRGNYMTKDAILYHTQEMISDGVDIIDVGGESTRPGYEMISDEEEIGRIAPAIEAIKKEFDIPISLDTYKSAVAQAGLDAGADMINDIWGLQFDTQMAEVVAKANAPYCLMHNRKEQDDNNTLSDFISQMKEDIVRATNAGIAANKIILDPGIGFAKNQEQNLLLLGNLEEVVRLGYPVLLGASRKSVINYVLDLPVNERLEGTLATTAQAVVAGCGLVRVHDVKENVRFINMLQRMREY